LGSVRLSKGVTEAALQRLSIVKATFFSPRKLLGVA
jgi:hypothetical protein